MNAAYTPDNTRSSFVIVLLIAAAVAIVAVLVGLSDKPKVDAIGITTGRAPETNITDTAETPASLDAGSGTVELDEAGDPILDDQDPEGSAAGAAGADQTTTIAVPTAEPLPTPEVAAAVEPTPVPDAADSEASDDEPAPTLDDSVGLAPVAGSIDGAFFTRPDEEEGAIVSENAITIVFNEDGSGTFAGRLDISYADETRISVDMTGPIVWTTGSPQVKAMLSGSYELDAVIDADDVRADEAELSITSLSSGSGSLCTSKCFGFTFPPPVGLW